MKTIVLDNDWVFIWPGIRWNTSTGVTEADAAHSPTLLAWLSATDGGATIHATLSKTMVETSIPGKYMAVVDGDALRAQLAASYIGRVIYEVFGDGLNVQYTVARKIVEHRRP